MTSYESIVADILNKEKKATSYKPYSGEVVEEFLIEPIEITYEDLINEYERTQKIKKVLKWDVFGSVQPPPQTISKEVKEVEQEIRESTQKTLEEAEEISKIEFEPEPSPEPSTQDGSKPSVPITSQETSSVQESPIEFEKEASIPTPTKQSLSVDAAKELGESQQTPELSVEKPNASAEEVVSQVQQEVKAAASTKMDELEIKKKMLELTKLLFKTKSYDERAKIKLQIRTLKNMLTSMKESRRRKSPDVLAFETILSNQHAELSQLKDELIEVYRGRIRQIKDGFYSNLPDDPQVRREAFDKFVRDIHALIEEVPTTLTESFETLKNKHIEELTKLKQTAKSNVASKCDARIREIEDSYSKELDSIKSLLSKEVQALLDLTGSEVNVESHLTEDVSSIIREINNYDEGTLLYFLHTKDAEFYKKYERKHISKSEAIQKAKYLMAIDMGLKKDVAEKYFGGSG